MKDYCKLDRYRLMALVIQCYETATEEALDIGDVRAHYRQHVQDYLTHNTAGFDVADVDRVTELLLAVKDILDKDN